MLTAALALAAHGTANGAAPSGGGATLLVVLAATLGGLATSCKRADGLAGITALLGVGQVLGHLVMAAAGHTHAAPGPAMAGAHAAAVLVGAVLIASAERLGRALSQTLRRFTASSMDASARGVGIASWSAGWLFTLTRLPREKATT